MVNSFLTLTVTGGGGGALFSQSVSEIKSVHILGQVVMIRIPPDLHTIIQGVEGERHYLLPKLVLQQVTFK